MKYDLVSFPLCPYVQRSIITLRYKSVPFVFREIDIDNPPEWFDRISPLGRVPVLLVDDKTVIFESAVINEFIDETTAPRLMSSDPLQRALERAWIQFGGEMLGQLYEVMVEKNPKTLAQHKVELFETFQPLETVLSGGPFFRGKEFSLVDAAFAPLFLRIKLLGLMDDPRTSAFPKIVRWANTLLDVPAVKESVKPDFDEQFHRYLQSRGSAVTRSAA
jgi:glutathione S-transferase